MMVLRVFFGALLAAIVVTVFGFLYWVVLPPEVEYVRGVENIEAVTAVLKSNLPKSGVYFAPMPGKIRTAEDPQSAMRDFAKKRKEGPVLQIAYLAEGIDPMDPAFLRIGLGHVFGSALLASILLALASPGLPSYLGRVVFVFLLGVFAAVAVDAARPVLFGTPLDFVIYEAVFHAVCWLLAGIVLAAVVKARPRVVV